MVAGRRPRDPGAHGAGLAPLLRYLARFRGAAPQIGLAAALLALTGALPGVAVWLLKETTDRVGAGAPVRGPLLGLLALTALHGGLTVGRAVLTRRVGWALVHELRLAAHRAWHGLPPDALPPVGDRLAALTHEADELQSGVSALVTAARNPIAVLALLGSAAWIAPGLAARFALLLPLLALPAVLTGAMVRRATHRWRQDRARLLAELADQHAGLPTTRDLRADATQFARAEALSAQEAGSRARMEWLRAAPVALAQVGVVFALVALIGWGAAEVRAGHTTAGGVVGFAVALGLLQRPLTGLAEVGTLLQRSLAALERVDALLARPVPVPPREEPPPGLAFQLRQARAGERLRGIDLDIPQGAKIALVGPSGAGKSSLLAALAGQLPATGLARRPALLLRQDPWVFDRTVAENLRLAAPGATDAELARALGSVGLRVALDRGLHDGVGERGGRYSGGERQRLCLARALLAQPEILLLDEASSELDPVSAAAIARLLADLPCTVVFAAHDGHFAAVADRVVALEAGRIRAVPAELPA